MKTDFRFGHALVKIGDTLVAVGGTKRVPDKYLQTIETFSPVSGWSFTDKRLGKG